MPRFPMGENANITALREVCPRRNYNTCFGRWTKQRYPSPDLFHVGHPRDENKARGAAEYARLYFANCDAADGRSSNASIVRMLASEDGPRESFTSAALKEPPDAERIHPDPPALGALRTRLRQASASATADTADLRCGSPIEALDRRLLILIGLPSSADLSRRREAARDSWMAAHPAYGKSVGACFLLSAHEPEPTTINKLVSEQAKHGDLLLLNAPETKWLIKANTKYSNFTRGGRGMPTFKQYAFFQHAARTLKHVPYIGKIDDDTAPNLGPLSSLLGALRCKPHVLIGAINWAGVIPNAHDTGVRNDRCGFGWGMGAALQNFGTSFGTPPTNGKARGNGYFPACDGLGAVPVRREMCCRCSSLTLLTGCSRFSLVLSPRSPSLMVPAPATSSPTQSTRGSRQIPRSSNGCVTRQGQHERNSNGKSLRTRVRGIG